MSVASSNPLRTFDWMHLHRFPPDQIGEERHTLARQLIAVKGSLEAELGMTIRCVRACVRACMCGHVCARQRERECVCMCVCVFMCACLLSVCFAQCTA